MKKYLKLFALSAFMLTVLGTFSGFAIKENYANASTYNEVVAPFRVGSHRNKWPRCMPIGIKCIPSEKKPYPALEKLIIDYYSIPDEFLARTKYYYNYIDLNGDGKDEIVAVVVGPYTSGTGGNSALIINKSSDKLEVKQSLTLINVPLLVSNDKTNGYNDLVVYKVGGGATPEAVRLKYINGKYNSVNDGEVVENPKNLKGSAIICNNLRHDERDNNYLTLKKK